MSEAGISTLGDVLQSNFPLFRHWYDFHYNVDARSGHAAYASVTKLYSEKAFDVMFNAVPFRSEIKRLILSECGLSEDVDYSIDSPELPFAMLQPETLAKLQPIIGALVCFRDVVKVIGKKDLGNIFALIGKDVYTFIVKRSLLFWKKIPNLGRDFSKTKLNDRIPMCGKLVLEHIIAPLPESVISRMSMRAGMKFKRAKSLSQEDAVKAVELVRYALINFFSDSEDAKLCLR
jgi:hypothetical protein